MAENRASTSWQGDARLNTQAASRRVRLLAIAAIAGTWAVSALIITAIGAEWYLTAGQRVRFAPKFARIDKAYDPFRIQHLNPFYLFFFPFEPERRVAMGNEICSIGAEGFRGAGPEAAGDKKLAFLLGGSAAFGHDASSNETTITGYLNRLQREYHFVNAGVPSWNSTQEMYRLMHQILRYRPALVITYDGANDAGIADRYDSWGLDYPPGTPESFETLHSMVDDLRAGGRWFRLSDQLFPRLARHIRELRRKGSSERRDETIEAAVVEYAHNLQVMRDITVARGGRFVGIFQPMRSLHKGVPDAHRSKKRLPSYRQFHALAIGAHRPSVEFHDFATYFDSLYATVPSIDVDRGDDIDEHTVFINEVHLYDHGNRLVAEAILRLL